MKKKKYYYRVMVALLWYKSIWELHFLNLGKGKHSIITSLNHCSSFCYRKQGVIINGHISSKVFLVGSHPSHSVKCHKYVTVGDVKTTSHNDWGIIISIGTIHLTLLGVNNWVTVGDVETTSRKADQTLRGGLPSSRGIICRRTIE
jgi:hypothetical protein